MNNKIGFQQKARVVTSASMDKNTYETLGMLAEELKLSKNATVKYCIMTIAKEKLHLEEENV